MSTLVRFMDHDRRGRWANLIMDNGDPCWIGIAQTGVLVKKSRVGLFGAKLYENPVLVAFVNAVLHCRNLAEVTRVLNEA